MDVALTYTNPTGGRAVFYTQRLPDGAYTPFLLNGITGVGGPDLEYDQFPITGGDGSDLGRTRYTSRIVQTNCMVYGKTDAERDLNLQELISRLNPHLGEGTLTYQNHVGTFLITGRCRALPKFGIGTKLGDWKPVTIDYDCWYPFWRGTKEYSAVIAASTSSFTLPFTLPFKLGSKTYSAIAENESAVSAPLAIHIYGPSVNPVVTNLTANEAMRVRKTIHEGEKLTIITGPRKSVIIEKADGAVVDAMNYVDLLSSRWLKLSPGANHLSYSSDDDSKDTRIETFWADWYLGVG